MEVCFISVFEVAALMAINLHCDNA